MKITVALAAATFFFLTAASSSTTPERNQLPPGPARITLTAVEIKVLHVSNFTDWREYNLFNQPAYKNKVGTEVTICTDAEPRWVICHAFVRLSRGTVVLEGLFPAAASFRNWAVSGGTGYYANVGGQAFRQALHPPKTLLLRIDLIGF